MRTRSLAIFFTAMILMAQLAIPSTLRSREEMRSARKGFPLAFVQQDLTAIDFPLPHAYRFSSPWENPTDLLFFGFFIDFTLFFLIISFLPRRRPRAPSSRGTDADAARDDRAPR